MIKIHDLTKRHGKCTVADSLCLHIIAGETVAISGPSGSGKTTLLRIIAGLEVADAGAISLAGRPVDVHVAPHRRGIAFLFQTAALWPHLSVAGNILFALDGLFTRTWREQRMQHLLGRMGLAGFADRSPATLSGGEARRVALARALAPQRPILLLDEPTSNLDTQLRDRMLELIAEERQANGTTIVLATHEHFDSARLADRCLALRDGRLGAVLTA